ERPPYHAILIDCDALTRAEIRMLGVFKRHVNLPIWLLPRVGGGGLSRSVYQEALVAGAIPFEDVTARETFLRHALTPAIAEGNNANTQPTPGALPQPLSRDSERQSVAEP